MSEGLDTWQEEKKKLYYALRTRVLTDEELKKVEQLDYHITVEMMVSYNEQDKKREFLDAMLQQFRLRLAVERANKGE